MEGNNDVYIREDGEYMIYLQDFGGSVSWRFGNVLDEKSYGISIADVTIPGGEKYGMGWANVMSSSVDERYNGEKANADYIRKMEFRWDGQAASGAPAEEMKDHGTDDGTAATAGPALPPPDYFWDRVQNKKDGMSM